MLLSIYPDIAENFTEITSFDSFTKKNIKVIFPCFSINNHTRIIIIQSKIC